MTLDELAGLAETALESQHVLDHYISLDTDQEPDWPKHRQALDAFNCHFGPREVLALLMVAKASQTLFTELNGGGYVSDYRKERMKLRDALAVLDGAHPMKDTP